MTDKSKRITDISFGDPAVYRVVVQGLLDETWRRRLVHASLRRCLAEYAFKRV